MTALLYSAADGYHDPQPIEIDRPEPTLTIDGRRYVLEPTRDARLYGADAIYREVSA